jgi:hypothetical protein
MGGRQVFIVDEGLITLESRSAIPNRNGVEEERKSLGHERAFRYGRMFEKSSLPYPDFQALTELGNDMHPLDAMSRRPSQLPAGYTYLGQFIVHDITFDRTEKIGDGELSPTQIKQGRSPSLELDSLYGWGPLSDSSRHLYENDCIRFKIGKTTPTRHGNALDELPNDLPRDTSDFHRPHKALISEIRNDRNLALAQTHLAFLKFHNAVVDHLVEGGQYSSKNELLGKELFEAARKKVIQHYQWIILHDYLPQILEKSVLEEVLSSEAEEFRSPSRGDRFLPVEFAFAAFRFGHCQVRDQYEWNRVFQSSPINKQAPGPARLHQLFTFGGLNGTMQGSPTLPTNWVIDWTRFYDFSRYEGFANYPKPNLARKIGTSLIPDLKGVAGFPTDIPIQSSAVAALDLHMGAMLGLPTGQEVAEILAEKWKRELKTLLLPKKIIAGKPYTKILEDFDLDQHTPLWFYILKEAEILKKGACLGPIGSWIVAKTIVGLIYASEFSILKAQDENGESWKPDLGQIKKTEFGMTDLLLFVNDLNPLGAVTASAKGAVGTPQNSNGPILGNILKKIQQQEDDKTGQVTAMLQEQSIAAIRGGPGSPAWKTYLRNFVDADCPEQLARLLGEDSAKDDPYMQNAIAYLVSNGSCGSPTLTHTKVGLEDGLLDQGL